MHVHVYSFSDSFPLYIVTKYWVEFPVLYTRSLLIIYFINSSVSVNPTLLIYPFSLLFPIITTMTIIVYMFEYQHPLIFHIKVCLGTMTREGTNLTCLDCILLWHLWNILCNTLCCVECWHQAIFLITSFRQSALGFSPALSLPQFFLLAEPDT